MPSGTTWARTGAERTDHRASRILGRAVAIAGPSLTARREVMIAPGSPAPQYCRPMRFHQSYRMLAGLALGVTLGVIAHVAFGDAPALQQFVRLVTEPAGKIFLRLLFVLVLPLIVSALALGVSGLGDVRALGRIGLKTFAYTVVVSSIAVLIGVAMVNLLQPGRGLSPELKHRLLLQAGSAPRVGPRAPSAA